MQGSIHTKIRRCGGIERQRQGGIERQKKAVDKKIPLEKERSLREEINCREKRHKEKKEMERVEKNTGEGEDNKHNRGIIRRK